jgi:uncharacterized membrane protein
MTRIALTIVVPLIVPSVLYLVWVCATGRWTVSAGLTVLPWPWLVASGLVLTVLTLIAVSVHYGNSPQGAYVPPRIEGGRVVPGHVVPQAKP